MINDWWFDLDARWLIIWFATTIHVFSDSASSFMYCAKEEQVTRWKFVLYDGSMNPYSQEAKDFPMKSGTIVVELMADYMNKGHIVYMDSYYMGLEIALYLKERGTGVVGTLSKSRKTAPKRVTYGVKNPSVPTDAPQASPEGEPIQKKAKSIPKSKTRGPKRTNPPPKTEESGTSFPCTERWKSHVHDEQYSRCFMLYLVGS
jgi:hypothetical protein